MIIQFHSVTMLKKGTEFVGIEPTKTFFTEIFINQITLAVRSQNVDLVGLEPTTPCLQSRCSSQLNYKPIKSSVIK